MIAYLPTFLAVCDEGGFHRAAERLHLSQPAVSYQIRMLEQALKVVLFERTRRGIVVTEQGKLLRDFCRRTLTDLDALQAQLRAGDTAIGSTLKIASVSGFGRYVLFPIVAKELGDIRVELRYPTQDEVLRFVAAGVCDVGVIYEQKISSLFDSIELMREELVLIAAAKSDFPRTLTAVEQAAKLPFITYDESEYVFGRWMHECLGAQTLVRSVAHFEELEEVVDYVRRGRGLSIVPDHCAAKEIRRGVIRVVRPRGRRRAVNKLYAVTRAGAYLSTEAQRLLALLSPR